jgi:hypothetical protein
VRHFRIVGPPRAPSAVATAPPAAAATPTLAGLPSPTPGVPALTYRARDITPNLGAADLLDFAAPEARVAITLDAALFRGPGTGPGALTGAPLGAWCYRE